MEARCGVGMLTAALRARYNVALLQWTIWEGGTHLTGFAHGFGLPAKVFTGLMHHCDWVPTLVSAAGGQLIDDVDENTPPLDGLDMWSTLLSPSILSGGPRKEVVMNIDPTNQEDENDPGGWSGYAAIRVGDEKLVLGWPGVPDSWCWPNQNLTADRTESECSRGEGTGISYRFLSACPFTHRRTS